MTGRTTPTLRFPGFKGPWRATAVSTLLEKQSIPVEVDSAHAYRQIGVRSHGKGIFYKECVTGAELGDKRVFRVVPRALVVNIVFAWEQAVALTTDAEAGFVASHRFPMFTEKDGKSYLPFLRHMFLTKRGKLLLEIASPGGAGRNKTLGQQEFLKLKPVVPDRAEQKKIADAVDAVDTKIAALTAKRHALVQFKAGLMQKLFSQQLRFTRDDRRNFPAWEEKQLGEVVSFHKGKGIAKSDVAPHGAIPCIRYGEIYTQYGETISNVISRTNVPPRELVLSQINDVIIPASGEVALDMARACCVMREGVAIGGDINILRSQLNGVFLAYFLSHARRSEIAKVAQGNSVVHLYASQLRALKVLVPHPDEQQKIADVLTAFARKIQAVAEQTDMLQNFKKGLLQQMFV
jgi:type I restriction enzyme, S subunit